VGKSRKGTKFDGLFEGRQGGRASSAAQPEPREPRQTTKASGVGRGKRSDADYRQVSAYVRRDTYQKVKIALLEEDREFSDLVEELLEGWLESRS
jgi:hypothetical protein